jgi:hypothetical protein
LVTSNFILFSVCFVPDRIEKGFLQGLLTLSYPLSLSSSLNNNINNGFFGEYCNNTTTQIIIIRRTRTRTNTYETNPKVLYVPHSLQTTLGDVQKG